MISRALGAALSIYAVLIPQMLQAAVPEAFVFTRSQQVLFMPANSSKTISVGKGQSGSLSSDNKSIAFCREAKNSKEIYELLVWDLRTKTSRVITRQDLIREVKWSPTSNTIAFTGFTDSHDILYTIQSDGSSLKHIGISGENGFGGFYSIRWDGDGKSIVFHDMVNVYRVDVNGHVMWKAPVRIFMNDNQISSTDCFAPCPTNPSLFAYTHFVKATALWTKYIDEPNTALYLYDNATKKRTRLTAENQFVTSPVWSRNGQAIFYSGYLDKHAPEAYPFRVYRINKSGQSNTEITKGEEPAL